MLFYILYKLSILKVDPDDYEQSEMLLYQATILDESGQVDQALEHLDTYSNKIVDVVAVNEMRGML